VRWPDWRGTADAKSWFITTEVFSPDERPGFAEFVAAKRTRCAALFHDAIPLKHPAITWPQSVARHAGYMKMLAGFDRVWAVSEASRQELLGFWRWQGVATMPAVDVVSLGADFSGAPRATTASAKSSRSLLCLGIIEPRKNQSYLLDVAVDLWREGLPFDLHFIGRVNPHFGGPIVGRIKSLRREFAGLHFHAAASDAEVTTLYDSARASVCPTIAEGCGLPLLESLWSGVPCVCSDLAALRENADGGGCVVVGMNDRGAWTRALRNVLTDDLAHAALVRSATTRALPTWAGTAAAIIGTLDGAI
jgi:glycosyltransferase involved in cell wall biosynthesis